jgi:hypothetical protein
MGVKSIKTEIGTDPAAGAIVAGRRTIFAYDLANDWLTLVELATSDFLQRLAGLSTTGYTLITVFDLDTFFGNAQLIVNSNSNCPLPFGESGILTVRMGSDNQTGVQEVESISGTSKGEIYRRQLAAGVWPAAWNNTDSSGVFTPTVQDNTFSDGEGQTYGAFTSGHYTISGGQVFFDIRMQVTSLGTLTLTDGVVIAGLPFLSDVLKTDTRYNFTVGTGTSLALPAAGTPLSAYMEAGVDYLRIVKWSTTGGGQSMLLSELTSSGTLTISGRYSM